MKICQACGGIIGKDCFNPAECAVITQQQAVEIIKHPDTIRLEAAETKLLSIRNEAESWVIAKNTDDEFTKEICRTFGDKILAILDEKEG